LTIPVPGKLLCLKNKPGLYRPFKTSIQAQWGELAEHIHFGICFPPVYRSHAPVSPPLSEQFATHGSRSKMYYEWQKMADSVEKVGFSRELVRGFLFDRQDFSESAWLFLGLLLEKYGLLRRYAGINRVSGSLIGNFFAIRLSS